MVSIEQQREYFIDASDQQAVDMQLRTDSDVFIYVRTGNIE